MVMLMPRFDLLYPIEGWLRCHSLKVRKVLGETRLAGVDGCRAGWIAAFVRPQGGEVRLRVVPRFAEVTAAREAPSDHRSRYTHRPAGTGGPRRADRRQRGALAPRRTQIVGIFGPFTPRRICRSWPFRRSAIEMCSPSACMRGRPGDFGSAKGITIFAFGIFSKIREVDAVLRSDRALHGGCAKRILSLHLAPQWSAPAGISEES
jgi:predicted RNase H-like nuclease